jgi:hypothetical protein
MQRQRLKLDRIGECGYYCYSCRARSVPTVPYAYIPEAVHIGPPAGRGLLINSQTTHCYPHTCFSINERTTLPVTGEVKNVARLRFKQIFIAA